MQLINSQKCTVAFHIISIASREDTLLHIKSESFSMAYKIQYIFLDFWKNCWKPARGKEQSRAYTSVSPFLSLPPSFSCALLSICLVFKFLSSLFQSSKRTKETALCIFKNEIDKLPYLTPPHSSP